MKRIRQKLGGSKGETLPEALIASLLAGTALLALSSMIMVSHQMIDRSNNTMKAFYEEVNQIEKQLVSPKNGVVTIMSLDNMQAQIDVKIYKTDESHLAAYTK